MSDETSKRDPELDRSGTPLWREVLHIALPIVILAAGVGVLIILSGMKPEPEQHEVVENAPLVETVALEPNEGGIDLDVDGVVVPYREVRLSAQVAGRIEEKSAICNEGRYVTKGTLLYKIDQRDYQLEIDRLDEELHQAEVSITEMNETIKNVGSLIGLAVQEKELQQREVDRLVKLREEYEHEFDVVSDTEFDAARRMLVVAETAVVKLQNEQRVQKTSLARLEAAKNRIDQMIKKAELSLERTEIRSPVDGVIITDDVEEDWYVNIGSPLVTIEDTSKVEVKCQLRPDEIYWVWRQAAAANGDATTAADKGPVPVVEYTLPRTPVTVEFTLGADTYAWQGVLDRYEGVGLDENTRTAPCRIVVDDPRSVHKTTGGRTKQLRTDGPPALLRGMYVDVSIHAQADLPLVLAPERAIQPNNTVICVNDGVVSIHPIEIVEMRGGMALIRSVDNSLTAGEEVVVSPLQLAQEGMKVDVHDEGAKPREDAAPAKTPTEA